MFDFLEARLYQPLFLFVITVLTLIQYFNVRNMSFPQLAGYRRNGIWMIFFCVLLTFFMGFRPVSIYFMDTVNYANIFENMKESPWKPSSSDDEWMFYSLMYLFAHNDLSVNSFFFVIEILYILPMLWACRRFSQNNSALLMLCCLGAFSFFTYGVNGIRNGVALSMVMLALTYISGNKSSKIFCAVLCFIAIGFHKSSALPILAMIGTFIYRKPKFMFYFWGASIIISLASGGAVSSLFEGLGFDDRLDDYITGQGYSGQFSSVGFRWDFLLYSFMPVLLGWYIIFKRGFYNRNYLLLLGTYIYSNAFWVMVIRSEFSNRFAYLSWFLYPIVLLYPLLSMPVWKKRHGSKTGAVLVAHLAFTLVMFFIF
ncbi:MAG: EpsG family protein [Bacteroidales bacterium]|nr:EpsG family protein [Bacteroidales bacterium]